MMGSHARPLGAAVLRGWCKRCPNCGAGPMLSDYLTVREHCPVCMEELHHHHSDDGPAYLTVLIVGLLTAPLVAGAVTAFRPDPLVLTSVFSVGCVALALYLLPRLTGVMVALQWAKRMHGFGHPAE
ncbi:hypothetical protein DSD19_17270 [Rhodovulum sp. BSW8]|uniref:Uncharacterized protein (DUF983 family) n=1 Tax=Rhodovulum visakhapatnamense TaxID=364297 RepID=A0A4R8FY77_9RHOB|nr:MULTISPECIES: DUF983 domain-containing protein [Rhodovulum]RBO51854.1 hypothetical protein DSD19_17270 [Rhodovulum sp. BSW8]TDX28534.1 uncharacterized protein (DUF983 family) [Rhodovulum visakhapatnamense]